jgi:hypothetical protein
MLRKTTRRALGASLIAMLAVPAIGCGSAEQRLSKVSSAEARAYAIDQIQNRLAAVIRLPPPYRSAGELLGNVRYTQGDGQGKAITDAVVVGTVSDVAPGFGFAAAASGADGTPFRDGTVRVPFDFEGALWRTVHITVDVDEVLSGDVPRDREQITVGLSIGNAHADAELIQGGIVVLGRTVWFLRHDSPVFAYDRSLYADIEDGALIAKLMPDGSLSFPMLAPEEPEAAILGRPTLEGLRRDSTAPPRVVPLRAEGNVWVR